MNQPSQPLTVSLIFDARCVEETLDFLQLTGVPFYSKERAFLRQALYDQVAEEFAHRFDNQVVTFTGIADIALPLMSFRTAMAVFLPVEASREEQACTIAVRINALPGSDLTLSKLHVAIVVNVADHG